MKKSDPPIVVEQFFNKSLPEVWGAITKLDLMKKWYFENIPEFNPEVGFETKFVVENEGRIFTHNWRIAEVIPGKLIKYLWSYDEYPGNAFVVFELFEENNGTMLRLTNVTTEDFPEDIPEFKRESCIGGWTYFINNRLKEYLEN